MTETIERIKPVTTEEVLQAMLTENTGRAMCDSGDYYGRNWERNQGRKFADEPSSILKFRPPLRCYDGSIRGYEIEAEHNVYHWLKERLDYNPDMQAEFDALNEEMADDYWHEVIEAYIRKHTEKCHRRDGVESGCYTYNSDNMLSQNVQFYTFQHEEYGEAVILQIHGGCDARGGMTAPKLFTGGADYSMYGFGDGSISSWSDRNKGQLLLGGGEVTSEHCCWRTEDGGYRWRPDECGATSCLGRSILTAGAGFNMRRLDEYTYTDDEDLKGDGEHLYVDPDGNGYCPHLGTKLELSW